MNRDAYIILALNADKDLPDISHVEILSGKSYLYPPKTQEESAKEVARLVANTTVTYAKAFIKEWRKVRAEILLSEIDNGKDDEYRQMLFQFCRQTRATPEDCDECQARFACWSTK